MAQYEVRQKTTTRHEYVLPDPTNWVEFNKALSYACQEYLGAHGRDPYDDSIYVTHADDEIIIYWEE